MSRRRERSSSRRETGSGHGSSDSGVGGLFGTAAPDGGDEYPETVFHDSVQDDYDSTHYDSTHYDSTHYDSTHYDSTHYDSTHYAAPSADARPAPARSATDTVARPRRADRHQRNRAKRRRGRRRLVALVAFVAVLALVGVGFLAVRTVGDRFRAADYDGPGTGSVMVQVRSGDGTGAIGDTLVSREVVASRRAFVDAARKSGRSDEFQPGFFTLSRHMSSAGAVDALLDPSRRLSEKVTVTEGEITLAIATKLATALKVPLATVEQAMLDVGNLGIPSTYGTPTSAEGFLYPATYDFDPGTTAEQALQQMVAQYLTADRADGFGTPNAATARINAYSKLIIASIVESEAKFNEDRGKVARVLYNRLARKMPLQSDATSAYGAKLEGKDPINIDYRKAAKYNTRNNRGLPPTPIGNPGRPSMQAAMSPTAGNWLYFVSKDADGHLFFTADYQKFLVAAEACRKNKWGCI